ncbi:hypothetical protein [Pseudomonas sp. MWU12-2323]|uniref:hypothetical protein n=1 Tax=Pseudomonas sp. MWU12-2323 TaxID=2651296 RepID=UPI00128DBB99|nr:hypothetical protein [Pseudomonas sp. MWU12-2323]MPQ69283.1 hypothetical protein [Pseudomonas sp. MWU12-2323]
MQATFDLFGTVVETKEISKPKAAPKTSTSVKLDRRKFWGEGGYLSTLEDDESSDHTTESFTEDATIERLEQALFMSPVIKNGKWAEDGTFYAYKLTKPVLGPRQFGQKGSFLRDATLYLIQSNALAVLEETYDQPKSWLPRWAYWLFCHRLRKAGDNEDPYELLKAFTAVMTQHDFLDASRKGDTLRRVTKRLNMRQKRAAVRASSVDDENGQCEDDTILKTA